MRASSGDIHVLHVDDDPEFADMAATFLQREDDRFTVEVATSSQEGLTKLNGTTFDCIVSDYEMPGRTGIELLEAVREEHPDLPFILFTGKGSEEVASDAISAGVTDYLQKEPSTSQFEVLANRIANAVEQVRAREIARETEDRLQTIAAHTTEILWMFSGDWDELLFVNQPYEDIWGRSIDELRADPRSLLEGIHPDDRDRVRRAMGRLSGGDPVDIEYRVNAAEDFDRWVWVQGEPVFDGDGEVGKLVGFARDITDRKRREQELQQARDHFQTVFETTNDAVFILDLENEAIVNANPQAEALLEYSRDELLSSVSIADIHPDDHEQYLRFLDRVRREEYGRRGDFQCVTKSGEAKTCEISVAPTVFDEDEYLIATVRDISERKAHERQLERFASIVSHDLRNPLNVIDARLHLVREEYESEHLDAIDAAVDRMGALIHDLLDLSFEGTRGASMQSVDLLTSVLTCWENVETDEAQLVTCIDRTILADEGRLQQLLENLFRNAVDHAGADVTVRVGELTDGFFVEDDGPGIPDGDREAVFEAGFSTMTTGTGLGLSIVEEVATVHGWEVRITESRSGGARFEVTGVGDSGA